MRRSGRIAGSVEAAQLTDQQLEQLAELGMVWAAEELRGRRTGGKAV
ncbi:hypothetical protein [Streptomyces agglomeratus]|nr:hypothetical protein [Streptomyces agglomeratus]